VNEIKEEIMVKAHSTIYTAHPGGTKMCQDLRDNFWWDRIKKDIAKFTQKCQVCQPVKAEHMKPQDYWCHYQFPNGNGNTSWWISWL